MRRVMWLVVGVLAVIGMLATVVSAAALIQLHSAPRLADTLLDQLAVSGYRKTDEYQEGLSSEAVFVGPYSPEPTRLVTGPALTFSPRQIPATPYTIVARGSFRDAQYADCSVFVRQLTDASRLAPDEGLTREELRRVEDGTFSVVVLSVLCVDQ